jgi:hypothetical protein
VETARPMTRTTSICAVERIVARPECCCSVAGFWPGLFATMPGSPQMKGCDNLTSAARLLPALGRVAIQIRGMAPVPDTDRPGTETRQASAEQGRTGWAETSGSRHPRASSGPATRPPEAINNRC